MKTSHFSELQFKADVELGNFFTRFVCPEQLSLSNGKGHCRLYPQADVIDEGNYRDSTIGKGVRRQILGVSWQVQLQACGLV
jgi:hypothetical protein